MSEKKDVLFLCQFFYPEYITSAKLPYQTATYLAKRGLDVEVLCGVPQEYTSEKIFSLQENINGINIQRVNYLQLERGNKISRLINYFSFTFSMLLRIGKLRNFKTVIVYSNPPILPIVAILGDLLFKTKIIFVAYDIYPEIAIETNAIKPNGLITKVMNFINERLYSKANIVALSNEMKIFIEKHRNVLMDNVTVIPNWATEDRTFLSVGNRKKNNTLVISYLGNMGIPQEFSTILKAISILNETRDVELNFAGHGNQQEYIIEQVKELGIEPIVNMYGFLTDDELDNLVDKTDILYLSFKEKLNGLAVPSKFYTYLLSNKPILAVIHPESDISKEIKKYNLGYVVKEGAVKEMVEVLSNISQSYIDSYDNTEIYNEYYAKKHQLGKYYDLVKKVIGE